MSEATTTRLERFAVVETVFDVQQTQVLEVAALIYDREGNRLASWETLVRPLVYMSTKNLKRTLDITHSEMLRAPFAYDAGPLYRCFLAEWKVQLATSFNVRTTFSTQQLDDTYWHHPPMFVNNGIAGYLNLRHGIHANLAEHVPPRATAMERALYSADALLKQDKFSPYPLFLNHCDQYLQSRLSRPKLPTFTRQDLAALRAGGAR